MNIRKPAVAGKFYPGNKTELQELLHSVYNKEKAHINTSLAQKNLIGGISPHAGYMFSAYQAIHIFEIVRLASVQYDTFIILNPNHSGYGPDIAIDENEQWETPLGMVPVDHDFTSRLNFEISSSAHKHEHSGEVMVPLLQYMLDYKFSIVPISFTIQSPDNAKLVANELFKANRELQKRIFIIASSDFSHFLTPEQGEYLDNLVVEKITNFQTEVVYNTIIENNISVCGYGPIMSLMEAALLQSRHPLCEVLKKGNSGNVIPSSEVVDYVSMLFYE